MTQTNWDEIVQREFKGVISDFYNPLVPDEVILEDRIDHCDTAFFNFIDNQTHMSINFLEKLCGVGEMDPVTAVRGISKHELGHYTLYPKECAKLMFLQHFAEAQFGEFKEEVVAYWNDIMDNLPQILKSKRGMEVRELYKGMNKLLEHDGGLSDKLKKEIVSKGLDPEEIKDTLMKYSVDRLLTAYYQRQSEEDLGVDITGIGREVTDEQGEPVLGEDGKPVVEYDSYLDEQLAEIMSLDFSNEKSEIVNFAQFGNIISKVLKKLKDELPDELKKGGSGSGKPGESQEGDGQGSGEGDDLIKKILKPMIGDNPSLGDFTDDQIEEGLDKIIQKWGKPRYEKIRDFVEKKTGKKFDRTPSSNPSSKMAGLASTELAFNDEQIPYYLRLASTHGLYIHKRPIVVDVVNSIREGSERFRTSDPVRTLNPFSTGGKVYPGITKRYKHRSGTKRDKLFRVPDLNLWIDSSGSMEHPKNGSKAVLASFIMARNYHENGSKIGVANFSTDIAFLLPTRNIDQVYSMLCAFWGGGTSLNIPKIQDYLKMIAKGDNTAHPFYTTEQDYEHLIDRMSPQERKQFIDKSVTINLDKATRETYEKIDNVLITDGGIFNLEEVIGYLNSTADITRNVVFLIDNSSQYEQWQKLHLPNTQIVPVDKAEDLIGLSIGEVKNMAPNPEAPSTLFY